MKIEFQTEKELIKRELTQSVMVGNCVVL
jgi:hypothetical protein